jgi:hypothetical protein
MDADEPAAGSDVSFERCFLAGVEDIAGCVEEHDDLVSSQYFVSEARCVFGAVHRKAVLGAKCRDGVDPLRDRVVTKPVSWKRPAL